MIADDNYSAGSVEPTCSLLTAKCIDLSLLIDYSTYFKEVIKYYCQFSPVSA